MDNPETQEHLKKATNQFPPQKKMNPCVREKFLIRHSYVTRVVKSSKSRVCDRGKAKYTSKGRDPFEKLIFPSDQSLHDDLRIMFPAMASAWP